MTGNPQKFAEADPGWYSLKPVFSMSGLMETALRVAIVLGAVGLALWVPKYLQENPVEPELERLHDELGVLESANAETRQQNDEYRTLLRGLREDPSVLDRRAREALSMSRADELIIFFDDNDSALSLR